MDLKLQNDIELCWGTPVFSLSWPESETFNSDLQSLILERRARDRGVKKSNQGGWHSTEDLLLWPSPHMKTLQERMIEGFRRATARTSRGQGYNGKIQLTAWANVNLKGHSNEVHKHPQSNWSGVYYVDVGDGEGSDDHSGEIHFLDPRGGAGMMQDYFGVFGQSRALQPATSQMLLFPSWLLHGVRPYWGERARISIAFNIALLDLM